MMPPVKRCTVTECFYNQAGQCRACAINVGGSHPQCDTFMKSSTHAAPCDLGQVGACKVSQCKYNENLSCTAPGIEVSHHLTHADCLTFEPR
ncbi:MAG TPA: DUF1540 domain-containing protein [Armatimonadota bacterium]|jgi:hypothetical protein|nr:DUF1540 domain-containing protein [Armatimonadota bacterium]HOJ21491.1 DUF1540 domain-containing protein [Armatimonadota bacterium]HOM81567.1 DUF1540 domain-containing protein [Armatimonadota bacterium]HOQ28451.1 DUF1540 domain-containing protein [Armatimonadota bacterium]HPO71160.1 DUF1540 domain-containing protein [Armatimonadota bacterium]